VHRLGDGIHGAEAAQLGEDAETMEVHGCIVRNR
jgi:hypothetical protein